MRSVDEGSIIRSLREHPFRSLFFWTVVTAFVAGFCFGIGLGSNVATIMMLRLPIAGFGLVCAAFPVLAVNSASRRGWDPVPYLCALLLFGYCGWSVTNLV